MKTTRTLRVLLVLMALVMLFPLAVACKKNESTPAETDAPSTEAPTQEKPRGPFDPPLIKVDSNASVYSGTPDTSWYTGDKTEYTLTSADQFVGFHALRSETCTFEGVTIKLGCDMIINKGTTEEIKARGASNYAWKNLDPDHLFRGNIDGQGHTISGVYMQLTDEGNASMFGSVAGTVKMKDFNLTNSYFGAPNAAEDKEVLAGLVSTVTENGSKLTISKVNMEITIEESGKKFSKAAGFVGYVGGRVDVRIDNSNFNGKISITGTHAGGFIAHVPDVWSIVRVTTCNNYAEITTSQYCGGMIGQCKSQDALVTDSINRGSLKCDLNCKNLIGDQITLHDPYEGAHPAIKEGTTGIRVLTFNVQGTVNRTDGVLDNPSLNRMEAIKTEIEYYTPDLVGLQEDSIYVINALKLDDYNRIQASTTGEYCAIYYKKGMKLLDSGTHWLTSDGTSKTVSLTYAEITDPNSPYYMTDVELERLMIYKDGDLRSQRTKHWDENTGEFVDGDTKYPCTTSRKFTYGVF
ncbi:MAG: hypothetical protein IJX19_09230, partial [Clostridia bacterium]|nr:hypothetical protein [Clostridia bacterium]